MKYSVLEHLPTIPLAIALLLLHQAAQSQTIGDLLEKQPAKELIDGTDPSEILSLAKGWGSASLQRDNADNPMIVGRIEGIKYVIFFYNCDDNHANCTYINFAATFETSSTTLDKINQWNASRPFGVATMIDDDTVGIELAVNLKGGVSRENLDDIIDWWRVASRGFLDFIRE